MRFQLKSVLSLFVIASVWAIETLASPTIPETYDCEDTDKYLCSSVVRLDMCHFPKLRIRCPRSCKVCKLKPAIPMTAQTLSKRIAECIPKRHPQNCLAHLACYYKALRSFLNTDTNITDAQLVITYAAGDTCYQRQMNMSSFVADCVEKKKKTGLTCQAYLTCFDEAKAKFAPSDKYVVDLDIVTAHQDHFLCQKVEDEFLTDMDYCVEKSDKQTCGGNLICFQKIVKLAKYKNLMPTFKTQQMSVFLKEDHHCPMQKACVDSTGACETQAKAGDCETSRKSMYTNCMKACGVCNCKDSLLMCPYYARLGKCGTNSVIATWCRVSCNTCGVYIGSNVTAIKATETKDPVIDFQESLELGSCVKQGKAGVYGYHCRKSEITKSCAKTHPDPNSVRSDVMTLYTTDFTERQCVNVLAFENEYLQCHSNTTNNFACGPEIARAECLSRGFNHGQFGHLYGQEHKPDLTHFKHHVTLCLGKLGKELIKEANKTCPAKNYIGSKYVDKCLCFDKVKARQKFDNMDVVLKNSNLLNLTTHGKTCTQGYELSALIARCVAASGKDPNNTRHTYCFKQVLYSRTWDFHLLPKTEVAAIRMKAFRADRYNIVNPPCTDKMNYCIAFPINGVCPGNYPFLRENCNKTCQYCFEDCQDTLLMCPRWAELGMCTLDKRVALRCRKSCSTCGKTESTVLSRMQTGRTFDEPNVSFEKIVVDSECVQSKVKGQFYDLCKKLTVLHACVMKTDPAFIQKSYMQIIIQQTINKMSKDGKCLMDNEDPAEKCYAKQATLTNSDKDEKTFFRCVAAGLVTPHRVKPILL